MKSLVRKLGVGLAAMAAIAPVAASADGQTRYYYECNQFNECTLMVCVSIEEPGPFGSTTEEICTPAMGGGGLGGS